LNGFDELYLVSDVYQGKLSLLCRIFNLDTNGSRSDDDFNGFHHLFKKAVIEAIFEGYAEKINA
jgi:hypothetical protein